jgi:hypothetical protein
MGPARASTSGGSRPAWQLTGLSNADFVEGRAWEGSFLAEVRRDREALEAGLAADGPAGEED